MYLLVRLKNSAFVPTLVTETSDPEPVNFLQSDLKGINWLIRFEPN
jgi:hypothetical protein